MGADGSISIYKITPTELDAIRAKYNPSNGAAPVLHENGSAIKYDGYIDQGFFQELLGQEFLTIYSDTQGRGDHSHQHQAWWAEVEATYVAHWEVWT